MHWFFCLQADLAVKNVDQNIILDKRTYSLDEEVSGCSRDNSFALWTNT